MGKKSGLLSPLIVGTVIIATVITVLAEGGWIVWLPVLLAFAVVGRLWLTLSR